MTKSLTVCRRRSLHEFGTHPLATELCDLSGRAHTHQEIRDTKTWFAQLEAYLRLELSLSEEFMVAAESTATRRLYAHKVVVAFGAM
jgi:hypothetical protein